MSAVAQGEQQRTRRMKVHEVRGGGGLRLHVREWGKGDGPPILFIHGLSQNHLCWAKQYESALADEFRLVAYDLRGHGMSEAPLEPEHYTDSSLWADDVVAIIDQLDLDRTVLVGWSYGAFVIGDYVRAHGQQRVTAINFVEGAVKLGEAAFGTLIGPGLLDHFADATADDLPTNIRAMRSFVRACIVKPVSDDDLQTAMCWNVVVPARIRANLAARQIDHDDVLRALEVPLLVTQGREDTVVLPAMAEHILTTCPTAEPSWYDGVGHVPHLEEPERFNRELAALTRRTRVGETVPADWISLGIGAVEMLGGAVASGSNGVSVQSDAISYKVGDLPAQGKDTDFPVVRVYVSQGESQASLSGSTRPLVDPCTASISLKGFFDAADEGPPVLANVRLVCDQQSGDWGTGRNQSELHFTAQGLPSAIGSLEEPHLQFQCRAQLNIPQLDNVIFHFVLDVNSIGYAQFLQQDFEYGRCHVYQDGLALVLDYRASEHGEAAD